MLLDLGKVGFLFLGQIATLLLPGRFLGILRAQKSHGVSQFLRIVDDFFVLRISQLPVDLQLFFPAPRFRHALLEIVALRRQTFLRLFQTLSHGLGRFPKRFVLGGLGIEPFIGASRLHHESEGFLGIGQQGFRVGLFARRRLLHRFGGFSQVFAG